MLAGLIENVPPVTRIMLGTMAALSVGSSLEIFSPSALYFSSERILHSYEIWRLFASLFFFGELSIHFCYSFFMMLTYASKLESDNYHNRTADFVYCLVLLSSFIIGVAFVTERVFFLSGTMLTALTYIWGRKNPHMTVHFVFFTVNAPYLAYLLLLFAFAANYNLYDHLLGIAAGHTIWFFDDIFPLLPAAHGKHPLRCPTFLRRY